MYESFGVTPPPPDRREPEKEKKLQEILYDAAARGWPILLFDVPRGGGARPGKDDPYGETGYLAALQDLAKAFPMATYGVPAYLRSDNGSEFIADKVQQWFRRHRIKTLYIDPGSPWQNPYIESFHSRFRDECLLREVLLNLHEARVVIEDWRCQYNTERPHSRLGYLSPEAFINTHLLTS